MEVSILSLISLRQMPTGRRRFAVRKVRELAKKQDDAELIRLCDESLAHDEKTAALEAKRGEEQRREANAKPKGQSRAVTIDNQLDAALGGLDGKLVAETRAYLPNAPEAVRVEDLRAHLFPHGVAGITHQSHVVQLHLVQGLLERADKRREELVAYGAGNLLNRIRSLTAEFDAALREDTSGSSKLVSADEVRAASLKGNVLVADIVVHVLRRTRPEDDQANMDARQRLLRPILTQDAVMFDYNRQNRKPLDVDPTTGEDVEPLE